MILEFVLLSAGVVVGTMFQRVTGMGFALLMAPVFALVFGPIEGILLMNVGGAVSSLLVLSRVWRDVDWRRLVLLLTGALPGGILGGFVVASLEPTLLQIGIGVLLVAGLTVSLYITPRPNPSMMAWGALVAGGVSGFTNATAGIGGPPVGIYAQASQWAQRNFSATLQPMFFVISVSAFVIKTVALGVTPHLPLWIYLVMVGFILMGLTVGGKVKSKVNERLARRAVIVFCYVGAFSAIVDGLVAL